VFGGLGPATALAAALAADHGLRHLDLSHSQGRIQAEAANDENAPGSKEEARAVLRGRYFSPFC
jgi:hypothetical protein